MQVQFYKSAINSEGGRYESPVFAVNFDKQITTDEAIEHALKRLSDEDLTAEYLRVNGGERIYF